VQRDSFDRLLLEHLPAGQRFAIRLTGDPHAAEDLLHDAIVRAVSACERFEARSSFTSWFFQIVVNCFRDRLRKRRAQQMDVEVTDVRAIEPASRVSEQELGRLVAQRVSLLPPRQREVIVLIAYENMSVSDAAEVLEISEVDVRETLFRARAQLKADLAEYLSQSYRGI
jgi:RNA polymerase sigma-70 factor (ECF subfamily)